MIVQDFAKRLRGYVPLVSATTAPAGIAHSNGRWGRAFIVMSISNMVLFLLTASMMTSLGIRSQKRMLNAELRATSSYTPIYDMIELEPSIRKINGTVMPAGKLSIARQFPNPAADAIWTEDIELIRPIPVTREQIIKMGKDPDTVAKLEDDDWGLGDDAYVAALDVFHNLHCLNVLRQAAYATYYNRTLADATKEDSMPEIHLNHCVDILFQHISCSSIEAHCINFEKLTKWHKEASVDLHKYLRVMKKPPGVKERPTEVWHPEEWFQRQN
ncbi:hypothetical protein E4U56_002176 [Claviceps arundinis]|uniref:Tat pathway signal sequence n=1 Tax=Claviceps arundinis TaxID=1623583 RepID=A0A9P7SPG3_9HYPO|nr:hypothetical protein E4U56_002176 [Claviceps arundinis]